jgi:class 3 adenylate cyclase/tetratricopeptide (TPR) repeat protein
MKCPKCQFENPDEMQFCVECGNKLEINCPKCGFGNSPSFKFCGKCGHNLTTPLEPVVKELSFDEKLDKIQRYLPKGLTEKILSQRNRIEGERKQVTVMFCDMEGYSQLSERLGPEEAYDIMDQIYEILIHRVHDYEGTVNEMTGDGVMALFGAPIALEDAPQRAVRSAMAIHREMVRFSDRMKEERESVPPLKMRVGIHSGPVVVGTLGNDLRVEFKAVGDTVNLASRMEGLAEPGTTYLTGDTFRLTEGLFRFEALGEKQVKGREKPVKVYRVIAPSTRRTRFDVSAERGLTPFVGRQRELELLLDGLERVKAGHGQAFSIVSEAGVGKSRLLYEFRKASSNEDLTFLEGKCLSYSRNVAYHPVADILRSNFDIEERDDDLTTTEKVKKGLKVLAADETSTLPYLLELLSVKDSGIDKIPMSPEARKDRIAEALNHIVLKGSEIRPLILAFEDLHWIDKSSKDVLKDLLDNIAGSRVFLILTYRPEFVVSWGGKSYHNQVNLNRLSNSESLAMVANLLGTHDLASYLEDLILEKTEGVPFFIEEFVRSLRDLNIIARTDGKYQLRKDAQALAIPSTIQDVIMARVDSLPEGAREVLQTGSVIEREFSYELINKVMDLPEKKLLSHLSALKDSELLYERGVYPQTTYVFKHALTREVVYDSILAERKKKLHKEIGDAIEELYRANLSEHHEVLAQHYFLSENYLKAADHSRMAGRKAEKAASFSNAIAHAKKRVISLEKLPQTDDVQKQIIDARTKLALYTIQLNYFFEGKEIIDPIIDLAIKHDYKKKLCQIYTILGSYHFYVEENYPDGFRALEKALKISVEVNDLISSVLAIFWLGCASSWNCEFEKSEKHFKRAIDMNVAAKNNMGMVAMKSVLAYFCYFHSGRINLQFQATHEAVQVAEEIDDIYSKAISYVNHGISCYGKGLLEKAEKYLQKGVEFCERIEIPTWIAAAKFGLAETYFEMGDFKKAKEGYDKASRVLERNRLNPSNVNFGKVGSARSRVMNKEKDVNLETLYTYSQNNKVKILEGRLKGYIGDILLNIDDQHISEAEYWILKAIESDQRNQMMFQLGKDYALYADLFKRKGDRLKTKDNLSRAIELFKECGADGWVKKYEEELASFA